MSVLVNEEKFCFQSSGGRGGAICLDDGFGNYNSTGPVNENSDWAPVDVHKGSEPNTVAVDLSKVGGGAFGIRYGWQAGGSCCAEEAAGKVTVWDCLDNSLPRYLSIYRNPVSLCSNKTFGYFFIRNCRN